MSLETYALKVFRRVLFLLIAEAMELSWEIFVLHWVVNSKESACLRDLTHIVLHLLSNDTCRGIWITRNFVGNESNPIVARVIASFKGVVGSGLSVFMAKKHLHNRYSGI